MVIENNSGTYQVRLIFSKCYSTCRSDLILSCMRNCDAHNNILTEVKKILLTFFLGRNCKLWGTKWKNK